MKTLKQHLVTVTISDSQRFDLGYKIARLWDKQKRGEKTYTIEDEFKVRQYPVPFLHSDEVSDLIIKFLNDEFDKLSNSF